MGSIKADIREGMSRIATVVLSYNGKLIEVPSITLPKYQMILANLNL